MIAPRPRLIFWAAWVLLPLGAVATALPGAGGPAIAVAGLLAALAVADALASRRLLDGLAIEIPASTRLSYLRAGRLEAGLSHAGGRPLTLRLGLALPPAIEMEDPELPVELPAEAGLYPVGWRVTPRERGYFHLDGCYAETASRAGLWEVRRRLPAEFELRSYPNLLRERRRVSALFLRRGAFGTEAERQLGKGREFEQLRAYQPGDSYEDIHWKATARRHAPVTKMYQVERMQEVYVVLDASRLAARRLTGEGEAAIERSISAALVLALAAERQGDHFGLLAFSDRVSRFVRARAGKAHFHACREALATLQPAPVSPDFGEIAAFVRTRLTRRALLVFLTDLGDPVLAESFVRALELVGRQHLVEVLTVTPPEARDLFEGAPVATVDRIYDRLAGQILLHQLRELGRVLRHRGAHLSLVGSEHLAAEAVSRYVAVKRRQLL